MTFFYLILALILIPLICIILISGIILVIIGIVNKRKTKYAGKKFPTVCITVGASLLALPALIFAIGIVPRIGGGYYNNVPERWRNSWVSDSQAADQAIKALMESAGKGDCEAFAKNFTAEIQNSPSFKAELDNFFEAYPAVLSECELDGGVSGSGGSYNYGHNVKEGSAHYTCDLEGEKYFISLSFCFENTDEPEKVGVEYFSVMNLGARALYIQESNEKAMLGEYEDDTSLICDIKSSDVVDARLIGGLPFVWHPTTNEKLTEDEMRTLLSKTSSMDSLYQKIGMANASIKYSNSTGYDYYYELVPENGEPRYAYISASRNGDIIDAYVFTPEKGLYDNPLKAFKKRNE